MSRKLSVYGVLVLIACGVCGPAFSQILASTSAGSFGEPRERRYGMKTLEKALDDLQKQYEVSFFYKTELVKDLQVEGNEPGPGDLETDLDNLSRQQHPACREAYKDVYVILHRCQPARVSPYKQRKAIIAVCISTE